MKQRSRTENSIINSAMSIVTQVLTVVLNFWAIEYKLSPDWTVYSSVLSSGRLLSVVGIFKIWQIVKVLLVKLFKVFKAWTVVLKRLAIEYKVSPYLTV